MRKSPAEAGKRLWREPAPAKVNLALHVTGCLPSGLHSVETVAGFAELGDVVTIEAADTTSLDIKGPMAGFLDGGANIILRAAAFFAPDLSFRITLEKNIPVAAGLGGGSADAAAVIRAIAGLSGRPLPDPVDLAVLGSDVPMCLRSEPAFAYGAGETLKPASLPKYHILLVNPLQPVLTRDAFAALKGRSNPGLEAPPGPEGWDSWLSRQRNDLEGAARSIAPAVSEALGELGRFPGSLAVRMSGSGATCFGLFRDSAAAESAFEGIQASRPGWWSAKTILR